MPNCLITLEPLHRNSLIVRIRRLGSTTVYCLRDIQTLHQLTACPLTRFNREYEYKLLNEVDQRLFKKIKKAKSHSKLVQLVENLQFNRGTFRSELPHRLLQGTTNRFFSNATRGLMSGATIGVFASFFMTVFSDQFGEREFSVHCLNSTAFSVIFGGLLGGVVDLSTRMHPDNPAHADAISRIATAMFFLWTVGNIVVGFRPELGNRFLAFLGITGHNTENPFSAASSNHDPSPYVPQP